MAGSYTPVQRQSIRDKWKLKKTSTMKVKDGVETVEKIDLGVFSSRKVTFTHDVTGNKVTTKSRKFHWPGFSSKKESVTHENAVNGKNTTQLHTQKQNQFYGGRSVEEQMEVLPNGDKIQSENFTRRNAGLTTRKSHVLSVNGERKADIQTKDPLLGPARINEYGTQAIVINTQEKAQNLMAFFAEEKNVLNHIKNSQKSSHDFWSQTRNIGWRFAMIAGLIGGPITTGALAMSSSIFMPMMVVAGCVYGWDRLQKKRHAEKQNKIDEVLAVREKHQLEARNAIGKGKAYTLDQDKLNYTLKNMPSSANPLRRLLNPNEGISLYDQSETRTKRSGVAGLMDMATSFMVYSTAGPKRSWGYRLFVGGLAGAGLLTGGGFTAMGLFSAAKWGVTAFGVAGVDNLLHNRINGMDKVDADAKNLEYLRQMTLFNSNSELTQPFPISRAEFNHKNPAHHLDKQNVQQFQGYANKLSESRGHERVKSTYPPGWTR